jgi:hypothetical protein
MTRGSYQPVLHRNYSGVEAVGYRLLVIAYGPNQGAQNLFGLHHVRVAFRKRLAHPCAFLQSKSLQSIYLSSYLASAKRRWCFRWEGGGRSFFQQGYMSIRAVP